MGTKNNPGAYDCHAKAEPDEPLFTLLARDPFAPQLVRLWADMTSDVAKKAEAHKCAAAMEVWHAQHRRK